MAALNMTTRKPANRLTLTISDELKQALADLNQATGVAAATFVSEIIEAQLPTISQLAEAAMKAKTDPVGSNEIMQRVLLQAVHAGSSTNLEIHDEGVRLRTYHRKGDRE